MQRYTFQLSVGNKISDMMDTANNDKADASPTKTVNTDVSENNIKNKKSDVIENGSTVSLTVKEIAEKIERSIKELDKEIAKDRVPLYTKDEEQKLMDKYTSFSKGKKELYFNFFKNADTSNLGFLTIYQFAKAVRKQGFRGKDSEIADMFVDIDANMDCEMTLEEFMDEMAKKDAKLRTEAEMLQIFKKIDRNEDGFISRDELRRTIEESKMRQLEIDIDDIMKRADKDGDGRISYDDFMKACRYTAKVK